MYASSPCIATERNAVLKMQMHCYIGEVFQTQRNVAGVVLSDFLGGRGEFKGLERRCQYQHFLFMQLT